MRAAAIAAWAVAACSLAEPPNLRRAAEGVYVGGVPTGGADWESLAGLGVRTVVGVDGLPPNTQAARRHGMRVIHVPIGYGEIDADASAQLARVGVESERPLYVYCHHGRHRGPAAAALICRAAGLFNSPAARQLLEEAGTDPKYVGLWRSVVDFQPPAQDAIVPPLSEASPVPPLRRAMSQLDDAWDRAQAAPDPATRDEAIVLANEALKESRRAAEAQGAIAEMIVRFDDSLADLRAVASASTAAEFHRAAAEVTTACVVCHTRHRDKAK